tara:strand:- start:265 stop:498 length:234 start_codon:yes stop_codon:yes gene_type:complete
MKITKSKLKKIIREELLKERTKLDTAYDKWHDASSNLLKAIQRDPDIKDSKNTDVLRTFKEAWNMADEKLIGWFERE